MATLGEELPKEIARVRDEVMPEYLKIPSGSFAADMMRRSMDRATKAIAEGDLVTMITAYKELKGYTL